MNAVTVSAIIAAGGFCLSVCMSLLIVGIWGGGVNAKLQSIDTRLARIEGAFTLVPTSSQKPPVP